MNTFAVDFETYYDDELSVTIQGAVNYALQADIYMVAIYGPGVEYVGTVEDAPWWEISGRHWVSHNTSFDQAVYKAACEKGQVPGYDKFIQETTFPKPSNWDCTADLAAYLGFPRSLAGAIEAAYNKTLDKAMRTGAKGKRWPDDFNKDQKKRMLEYAMRDSEYCWQLWHDFSDRWPQDEIELSRITRKRALQGVKVDRAELGRDMQRLVEVKENALKQIPWADTGVILSPKQVSNYCVTNGIPVPASLSEKSEECAEWEETYGNDHPVVGAIRAYRKANRLEAIVMGMIERIMPDGRMNFGLKYFGAHTGRWSGSDGLNMQNPNKDELFGVNIRHRLVADEGRKFIIADLAQIEPRCTAYLNKDTEMLQALRDGFGIYEAFAVANNIWKGAPGAFKAESKEKKDRLYDLVKAQVLALGYGAGPAKFIIMAKAYCDLEISMEDGERIVREYREKAWRIPRAWGRLETGMRDSINNGDPNYQILLPSGRRLTYTKLSLQTKEEDKWPRIYAAQGYAKDVTTYWGGKLLENAVQACARDVLAFAILNLERAGVPVLWSAHDEVICEVPIDFDKQIVKKIMTTTPPWLPGLVLDADVAESAHYLK